MGSCEHLLVIDEPICSPKQLPPGGSPDMATDNHIGRDCRDYLIQPESSVDVGLHQFRERQDEVEQSVSSSLSSRCVQHGAASESCSGSIEDFKGAICHNTVTVDKACQDGGFAGELENGFLPELDKLFTVECGVNRIFLDEIEAKHDDSAETGSLPLENVQCSVGDGSANYSRDSQMPSEDQLLDAGVNSFLPEDENHTSVKDTELVPKKSNISCMSQICYQVLPSQDGLELSHLDIAKVSLSDSTQQFCTNDAEGYSIEKVPESYAQKLDVLSGWGFGASETMLNNMENHVKEGYSCEAYLSVDKQSLHQNLANTINYTAATSVSSIVEIEDTKHARVGDIYEIGRNEMVSLRRSSRKKKFVQKAPGRKYMKNTVKNGLSIVDEIIDLLPEVARRKRSRLTKSVRSVAWGLLANLLQRFEQSNGLPVDKILSQGPRKAKGGQRKKKKNNPQVNVNSQRSRGKNHGFSRPIRLKVTFGGKVAQSSTKGMPSAGDDISAGVCSISADAKPSLNSQSGNRMDASGGAEIPKLLQVCSASEISEKPISRKDNCVESHPSDCDLDSNFTTSKSDGNHCRISSHTEAEKSGASNNDGYVELGTSPDSEVINQVPDSQLGAVPSDLLRDPVLALTKAVVASADVPKAPVSRMFKKRGHKNKKSSLDGNHRVEDDNTCFGHEHKDMTSEKCQQQLKMHTAPFSTDTFTSTCSGNASSNASGSELISVELIHEGSNVALGVDKGVESALCPRTELGIESAESWNSKLLPTRAEVQGNVLLKGSKSKGKPEKKSKLGGGVSRRKDSSHSRKCNKTTYASRFVSRENGMTDCDHEVDAYVEPGDHRLDDVEKTDATKGMTSDVISSQRMVPCGVGEQTLPPRKAWVCCDDCEKWRCIPAVLADVIEETNCRWTCKDNQDKAFANCSIPQEKSNAEINAELDISDDDNAYARAAYSGVKGYSRSHATVPRQAPWTLIKSNVFLHRKRRSQTMDEIMVCHCNPPTGGRLGCRGECLNRMLNIECNRHTCPCGDICSNQQFQQRKYAKLNSFLCGKKGYGLQVLEDLSQGKFVIEYVGEVLDMPTYEARQREYALKGHKHFYFMTLNGNEVIDACAKGNLGRFINHSCDPNCRTEKWMVNGEICIGLFALRDIKKGEELTFDYNYVRVFGAAAKKCHCGSSHCRGYIGGDPLTDGVLVQDDSDEEFPEPLVVYENGKIDRSMESIMCMSDLSVREVESKTDRPEQGTEKPVTDGGQEASIAHEKDTIKVAISVPPMDIPEIFESIESEDVPDHPLSASSAVEEETSTAEEGRNTPSLSIQTMANPPLKGIISKSLSNLDDAVERKSSAEMIESKKAHPKQRYRTKVSHASESVKNHKSSSSKILPFANKSLVQFGKPKKLPEGSANRHLEAVEEKLNDLLDVAGGIYKRKDASKGYLKLLLLTAASGDSGHGGAIQSNRDLSMILDAILKTKSRGVLVDIINKNGLQMLHNMMKQYRHDFKKIPILRKLLKVFEFLAEREILTPERINADPPCLGVESFRQSILSLTEHEDKKVHQIARNFRDRWIPRPIRKTNNMEKGERRMDFNRSLNSSRSLSSHQHWRDQGVRPSEAIDCPKQSALRSSPIEAMIPEVYSSLPGDCAPTVGRVRKRKSRWDQPAVPKAPRHSKEQTVQAGLPGNSESSSQLETGELGFSHTNEARKAEESSSCRDSNREQIKCSSVKNGREETEEDAPPGFSSPFDGRPSSSACSTIMHMPQGIIRLKFPSEVGTGVPQERFNSRLPVAYGVPFMVMEQHGTPQTEMGDQWLIAPGVPFHPFPPLPPYPHDRGDALGSPCGGAVVPRKSSEKWLSRWAPSCLPDQEAPSTSDVSHQDSGTPITIDQNTVQQKQAYAGCYGRRFFRQQKFQHSNSRRPFWKRNGKRFKGNCYGNKAFGVSIGTVVQNQQQQQVENFSVNSAGNSC